MRTIYQLLQVIRFNASLIPRIWFLTTTYTGRLNKVTNNFQQENVVQEVSNIYIYKYELTFQAMLDKQCNILFNETLIAICMTSERRMPVRRTAGQISS